MDSRLSMIRAAAQAAEAAGPPVAHDADTLSVLQRWMATVSGKWCIPILDRLAERPARYNNLLAGLDSVAPKVLTQTLRRLESEGFVRSQRVGRTGMMYCLTDRGAELRDQISPLRRWAAEQLAVADM